MEHDDSVPNLETLDRIAVDLLGTEVLESGPNAPTRERKKRIRRLVTTT
jgi:hypothetical protein